MGAKNAKLWYRCQYCGEMTALESPPFWLETDTILFCQRTECGKATVITLAKRPERPEQQAVEELIDQADAMRGK